MNFYDLKQSLYRQRKTMLTVFASVFFWGMLAHMYGFLHCNLSHDVLNAFIATSTEEIWKIELGRYFVPLYRAIFRGAVSLPWLIGVLGLTWTAITVFFVQKIFSIQSNLLIFLISGIMTTNITYISQIATYIYEFDFNAFALMLSVLAVYLWEKDSGKLSLFLGGFCLMFSIGIYQAYFTVTITLIVWKSVMDLLDEQDVTEVFIHGLKGIFMILLGGVFYFLIGKLIYALTGIVEQDRTNIFSVNKSNPVLFYLKLILISFVYFGYKLFHIAYSYKIKIATFSITLLICIAMLRVLKQKKYAIKRTAFICILTAATPFAMSCIYVLARGEGVHDLMIYAFWFFYVFVLLLAFKIHDEKLLPENTARLVKLLSCILVFVLLWENVVLANTAYVKKETEANATLSTMTRVVSMMEQQENYSFGNTTVAFIGATDMTDNLYGNVEKIIGLDARTSIPYDTPYHYYHAYEAYFKYVLQYPIQFCTNEDWKKLKKDSRVEEMPAYPENGYIKMIDDILVVKMGN